MPDGAQLMDLMNGHMVLALTYRQVWRPANHV